MSISTSLQAIRVLLVEAHPGEFSLLQALLSEASSDRFDLIGVESLTEALTRLSDDAFDVILLDLPLPDRAEVEFITRIRSAAPDVAIVVLTESNDEVRLLQMIRAGAHDYLLKEDLDPRWLKRILRNAIERKRAEQVQNASEARFRALVQNSTDIITILAADGTVMYESPSLEKVMGYLKLPKVSGLEVLERIRADEDTRMIPVVILTSSREERDIVESYRLHVNSYIVKLVDFEQFTISVRQIGFYWLLLNEPPIS